MAVKTIDRNLTHPRKLNLKSNNQVQRAKTIRTDAKKVKKLNNNNHANKYIVYINSEDLAKKESAKKKSVYTISSSLPPNKISQQKSPKPSSDLSPSKTSRVQDQKHNGVEDSKKNKPQFSNLPEDVVCDVLMRYLDRKTFLHLSQASKNLKGLTTKALKNAQQRLPSIQNQINELIIDSRIKNVRVPYGPFKSAIEHLQVLENLLTAINTLIKNDILNVIAPSLHNAETPEIAKALITAGININEMILYKGTALNEATRCGRTDIAVILIQAGANPNTPGYHKDTPLHHAKTPEMIKVLLVKGAKVDARNTWEETPLHKAASSFDLKKVNILTTYKANVNARNYFSKTPLHLALDEGYFRNPDPEEIKPIVNILIDAGAEVNARDYKDKTPLHYAAENGCKEVVEELLKVITNKKDLDLQDNRGNTPLHLAKTEQIREILIEAGADTDTLNNKGETHLNCSDTSDTKNQCSIL